MSKPRLPSDEKEKLVSEHARFSMVKGKTMKLKQLQITYLLRFQMVGE